MQNKTIFVIKLQINKYLFLAGPISEGLAEAGEIFKSSDVLMECKDPFLCHQHHGYPQDHSILHFPSCFLTDPPTYTPSFWGPQLRTATPGHKNRKHDGCGQDKLLDGKKKTEMLDSCHYCPRLTVHS